MEYLRASKRFKAIKTLALSMLLSDSPTVGWHDGSYRNQY